MIEYTCITAFALLRNNIWEEIFMAYNITDACVKCGACAENCPVEAISEGEDKFVIDADVCVSCGACAENCPVEAIEEG
jgi:ferredoxin